MFVPTNPSGILPANDYPTGSIPTLDEIGDFEFQGTVTVVTAVCEGANAELIRSLGADRVIDYEKEDFTKDRERYDFVFDAIGKSSFLKCKALLKRDGQYTSSGGAENAFFALVTPLLGGKKVPFVPPRDVAATLRFILDIIERGCFRPLIDRTYPLDEIADAFTHVASGQKLGNVIVVVDD